MTFQTKDSTFSNDMAYRKFSLGRKEETTARTHNCNRNLEPKIERFTAAERITDKKANVCSRFNNLGLRGTTKMIKLNLETGKWKKSTNRRVKS
jgi:hypothetical protein